MQLCRLGGGALTSAAFYRQAPQRRACAALSVVPSPRVSEPERAGRPRAARPPGARFQDGLRSACSHVNLEIVKRADRHKFVVPPKRWIVERTIAWLNRCRRSAKDWECLNSSAPCFLRWASICLMLRRLCQANK